MTRRIFALFCLSLVTAIGCAITDYGIITDNDQVRAGGQAAPNETHLLTGEIVNTNGPAHKYESSQVIVVWPDGSDNFINFVDQKADGTATLTTYNNFSSGDEPPMHTDLYCNPDWNGCSVFTASDDNDDLLFDGTFNTHCPAARSLSILLSTGRYYGECGRRNARFSIDQKIAVLNHAVAVQRYGRAGLLWRATPSNTIVRARNDETGQVYLVPSFGVRVDHFKSEVGNSAVTRFDHPMLGPALTNLAGMLEKELRSESLTITVEYNGVPASFRVAGGAHELVRSHVRNNARRL